MEPSYTFIDHTADVLFEAKAPTLNELFKQCALALEDTQVHIENVETREEIEIKGKNKKIDLLLYDFLDDLVFYKDAESLVFSQFSITIAQEGEDYTLHCKASGEKIDVEKHQPKVDVKAITLHLFEVKEIAGGYSAKVLLDI